MSLTKQARMLQPGEISTIAAYLGAHSHDPLRDTCILYLSVYAGLRAKEIAGLDWSMLDRDTENTISLTNAVSKGTKGGRVIPMHPLLVAVVGQLRAAYSVPPRKGPVLTARTGKSFTAHAIVQKFRQWYARLDMEGCSSHSGRRTFITTAARTISLHGGSLEDVRDLAGHTTVSMTQRYIVVNEEAKRNVVAGML